MWRTSTPWSPSGDAFVYTSRSARTAGEAFVQVVDLDATESQPDRVCLGPGGLALWSPQ